MQSYIGMISSIRSQPRMGASAKSRRRATVAGATLMHSARREAVRVRGRTGAFRGDPALDLRHSGDRHTGMALMHFAFIFTFYTPGFGFSRPGG